MNESKILLIETFEDKVTKDGKAFSRFKTSEGWMSCFDFKVIKNLKESVGKTANCQLQKSGQYSNIVGFNGLSDVAPSLPVEKTNVVPKRNTTMYVSYAKDIFCKYVEVKVPQDYSQMVELMNNCVNVVKLARKRLE